MSDWDDAQTRVAQLITALKRIAKYDVRIQVALDAAFEVERGLEEWKKSEPEAEDVDHMEEST